MVVAGDDREFSSFLKSFVNINMNRQTDFRVFLIPHKVNTLAQYLAMYDDLYCSMIYLPFTQNPLFSIKTKIGIDGRISGGSPVMEDQLDSLSENLSQEEWGRTLSLMDDCLQDYLRDAVRIFPLKVYQCDFYREDTDEKPYKTVYFTGRFELGHCPVYKKLKAVNRIQNASNLDQLSDAKKKFERENFADRLDEAGSGQFDSACEKFNDD